MGKVMINTDVTQTDKFQKMPNDSKLLYYELMQRADNDGFVGNPVFLYSALKINEHFFKILIASGYLIPFNTGVIVITEWKRHNKIRPDRYKPTIYQEEYAQLAESKDVYLLLDCQNDGYIDTQYKEVNVELVEEKKKTKQNRANKKWHESVKNGSLPRSFEYKIKCAFEGIQCPVCDNEMYLNSKDCKPTILHNIPISLGGIHELNNISIICNKCNNSSFNRREHAPLNTELVTEKWFDILQFENNKNEFASELKSEMGLDANSKWVRTQTQICNTKKTSICADLSEKNGLQMGSDANSNKNNCNPLCNPCNSMQPTCNPLYSTKVSTETKGFESNKDLGSDAQDSIKNNIYNNLNISNSNPVVEPKKVYGEFDNVYLTNTELEKLKIHYPTTYEALIEKLSCHMASTGNEYQNHYATIRTWELKRETDQSSLTATSETKNKWKAGEERGYDFEQLEKDILSNQ